MAQSACPWHRYYPKMIDQSLKQPILLNAQDNQFVQCVSPILMKAIIKNIRNSNVTSEE